MPNRDPRAEAELLLIGVTSPIVAALYENGRIVETFVKSGKSSEVLPPLLHEAVHRYRLRAIYYANGPGSFMAIKVTYVMAKTLSIALDIPLYGADAFLFNENRPIKAVGKSCFVKENGKISIRSDCRVEAAPFVPPPVLDRSLFSKECEPLYVLPPV
ncbi:hypothetical protein [Hydrogenimonas sp.]